MTLTRCLTCTTVFSVDVDRCPWCDSTNQVEVGAAIDADVTTPSRKELLKAAERLLISVPSSATKPQIQDLIDGATDGDV